MAALQNALFAFLTNVVCCSISAAMKQADNMYLIYYNFMLCSALLLSFSFRVHGSTLGRIIPAHPCTANRKPHGDQSNGNDAKGMLEGQLQTFTFLKSHQSLIKSIYFRTEIPSSLHSFTCNQCTPNTKSPKIQTFISACLLLRHSQSQMCSQRII